VCRKCNRPLEVGPVAVEYMGNQFTTELPACPGCGFVLISEALAWANSRSGADIRRQVMTGTDSPSLYESPALQAVTGPALRPGGLELTRRSLALCDLPAGARVVDIGCGTGVTVHYLRRHCRLRAFGLDAHPACSAGPGSGTPSCPYAGGSNPPAFWGSPSVRRDVRVCPIPGGRYRCGLARILPRARPRRAPGVGGRLCPRPGPRR